MTSVHHHSGAMAANAWLQLLLALPFVLASFLYLTAFLVSKRKGRPWPVIRLMLWLAGTVAAMVSVAGPLAEKAHHDFAAHMMGHLLLGMLAPLLMVMAAPRTLLLRALPVLLARKMSRLMQYRYFRVVTDPAVASLFNIGGLWLLYTTPLYAAMHDHPLLHLLIHIHVFLAGYVFTSAMIDLDPSPWRPGYVYRAAVLILALGAHSILAKYLYAHPPHGVPQLQAEQGAVLMYYGGDVVDALLILIFCWQWYRSSRSRITVARQTV